MSFLLSLVQLLFLLFLFAFTLGRIGFGPGGPTRVLACNVCGQRPATIE